MKSNVRSLALLLFFALPAAAEYEALEGLRRLAGSEPSGSIEAQHAGAQFERVAGRGAVVAAPASAETPRTLAEKARHFDEQTVKHHRPFLGIVLSRRLNEDGSLRHYDDFGDSLIWTGTFIAAMAHKHAATGDPEAVRLMEESLHGYHAMHEATGTPGLVARNLTPLAYMKPLGFDDHKRRKRGAGKWSEWIWEGDLSWDQYCGYLFGVASAWPYIRDEALRETLRADLRAVGEHFIANDMRIKDAQTFLDARPNYFYQDRWPKWVRGLPMPPVRTGNSVHGLHLMKVVATVTGDRKFHDYYLRTMIGERQLDRHVTESPSLEDVLESARGVLQAGARAWSGEDVEVRPKQLRSYIGQNLMHMALYDLVKLEQDPDLKEVYRTAMRRLHTVVQDESNSWWNYLYAGAVGADDHTLATAEDSMRRFPLVPGRVDLTNDPSVRKYRGLNGDLGFPSRLFSYDPLPMDKRPLDGAFPWQNNPYSLQGGPDHLYRGSGAAYSTAYWLGRFHGFIEADQ